jgi:hypothetical protein
MDQLTLVANQITDGQRLAEKLAQNGFEVTAAGWIRTTEDGQWFLYLVSPVVDEKGPLGAYRRVNALLRQMPQPFSVHSLDVKLIGPTEPIAEGIQDMHRRYPAKSPIHLGETQLNGVSIDGAYIYPPLTAAV